MAFDLWGNTQSTSLFLPVTQHVPDLESPTIVVFSPRENETMEGSHSVNITARDQDGMDTVEVFLDGEKIYSVNVRPMSFAVQPPGKGMRPAYEEMTTPVVRRLNITFSLDTLDWDNGDHELRVVGWDLSGNTTDWTIPVKIFNLHPGHHPRLLVTRPDARLDPPGFRVKLRIRNVGDRRATGIMLLDVLHGYFATGTCSPSGVTVLGELHSIGTFSMAEIHVPDLEPGETILVSYQVVPVLREFFPQGWDIGGSTWVQYNGTGGRYVRGVHRGSL